MATVRPKVDLTGSLAEFSLPDVVQFLCASSKTGRLDLEGAKNDGNGAVYFDEGTIVHAETGALDGEEAFYELMRFTAGRFAFDPGVASPKTSIRQSSTMMLMEGARRNDEWGILEGHIPDMTLIPEFVLPEEGAAGKQITLNTSEWMVLAKVDGKRSLKDVAEEAQLSDFHTCRLLYPLVANKLIRLREPTR